MTGIASGSTAHKQNIDTKKMRVSLYFINIIGNVISWTDPSFLLN